MDSSKALGRQQSRARVLDALRAARSPLGIAQLTEQTGLSAGSVRFHLSNLLQAGSIRALHPHQPRRGRPAVEYESLPVDAADPAQAYRMLAAVLGRELRRSANPEAAFDAGRHWAEAATEEPAWKTPASAVDTVAQLLRDGGFDPTVRADGRTVELHQCPFYALATELPAVVCSVHHGLTAGALDRAGLAANVRVIPVLNGSGPCLVHVDELARVPDSCDSPLSTKEIVP